jgi:mycothiol synthase
MYNGEMNSRRYESSDLYIVLSLLKRIRPPEWLGDYPAAVDLQEILAQAGPASRTRLWFDENGQPVAYALVDAFNNLLCEIDPHDTLEDEGVSWGVECIHAMRRQGLAEAECTLDGSCRQEDSRRMQMLLGHGFQVLPGSSIRYRRSLEGKIPTPSLPTGFALTHAAALAGDPHLVERIVALHRAGFGTEHMTVEERQSIMSTSEYSSEMDLFIVAPDGRLAGYCTCSKASDIPGVGHTDPIAVHPNFQRLGLGRALVLSGLHVLQERGLKEARLTTSSENIAMQALAQAAGFEEYERMVWLARKVEEEEK